jgi:hypothetical protein
MRIITRVMRLSDLRTDVQVQYEDAVGNVHRAVITCAKRGLRAKTLLHPMVAIPPSMRSTQPTSHGSLAKSPSLARRTFMSGTT